MHNSGGLISGKITAQLAYRSTQLLAEYYHFKNQRWKDQGRYLAFRRLFSQGCTLTLRTSCQQM
jgi:hypothetical protein